MERPIEGGSETSEGGRFERRTLNDVILPSGQRLRYVDRNYFIDIAIQAGVNFDKLPQLPFWAGVAGYSDTWRNSVVGSDINYISSLAGRPLTEEEAQHVGEHSANKCRATTHYTPMWTSATAYFWWKGMNTFRFPFYTPKPGSLERVSKRFFSPVGIKLTQAPLIWHALRLVAYSQVTSWTVAIFFGAGPTAIFAGGLVKDRNLQELNKELAERAREAQRQQRRGLPTTPEERLQELSEKLSEKASEANKELTESARELQREFQRQYPLPTTPAEHPHSPINENAPTPVSEQWGQTTAQPGEQPQQPQGLWRPKRPSPVPARAPTQQSEPEPRYSDDDEAYLFDDASPVAPSARRQNLDASTPVGGSAWTRLRTKAFIERSQDQANEGSAAPPRTSSWEERRQQNSPGGSYTYSPPGEEKDQDSAAAARSRAQAQKEFDAMLERERRGN